MKYSKQFIKELEQVSYYVTNSKKYAKPSGWSSIKNYENDKNGFKAEAFEDTNGKIILLYAGTNPLTWKDDKTDISMAFKDFPQQAYDAYLAYEDLNNHYDNVIVAGYSLGGSLAQIVCNETGAEGITFAPYGVGDIVNPKHTNNIINFGNENDFIFTINMENQLGTNYIIPDDITSLKSGRSISKHMPNQIGDITKAVEQKDLYVRAQQNKYILDRYVNKKYDDNLLTPSNRIFYENEMPIRDMDEATMKQFVSQYYDDDYKFPKKEELNRRVRFGELIYVENYTRSDGTKVSGYYRRRPVH